MESRGGQVVQKTPDQAADGNSAAACGIQDGLRLDRRQHLSQDHPYHPGPMLARRAFECIGALKSIRPRDLHFPLVIRLGADDRHEPIARPIGQQVFDDCCDFGCCRRIAGILDVDYDCHTAECIRSRGV